MLDYYNIITENQKKTNKENKKDNLYEGNLFSDKYPIKKKGNLISGKINIFSKLFSKKLNLLPNF